MHQPQFEPDLRPGRWVFPIHANARDLPYAEAFFDAIVCVDAYIYFGTDDPNLAYLQRYVKPGGQIGIVVPGFMQESDGPLSVHLRPFWAQECWSWHAAAWWAHRWARTSLIEVQIANTLPGGGVCDRRLAAQPGLAIKHNHHGQQVTFITSPPLPLSCIILRGKVGIS